MKRSNEVKNNSVSGIKVKCPACGGDVGSERIFLNMMVCECGWTSSVRSKKIEHKAEFGIMSSLIFSAILILLGVFHYMQWDVYSLDILQVRTKEILGMARLNDLERKNEICKSRGQSACQLQTMKQLHRLRPQELKYLADLARIQLHTEGVNESNITLKEYIQMGGNDYQLLFAYAQHLAMVGEVDLATHFFEKVLQMKPDVLQIQVARSYVSMLMAHSRYEKARTIIEKLRRTGESAAYFLDEEMREIKRKTNHTHHSSFRI